MTPEPGRMNESWGDCRTIAAGEDFAFVCAGCGNCCRERRDLVLSGYDLYRIARRLSLSPRIVAGAFCKSYVAPQSCLPTLRLTPDPKTGNCRFLKALPVPSTPRVRWLVRSTRWGSASTHEPPKPSILPSCPCAGQTPGQGRPCRITCKIPACRNVSGQMPAGLSSAHKFRNSCWPSAGPSTRILRRPSNALSARYTTITRWAMNFTPSSNKTLPHCSPFWTGCWHKKRSGSPYGSHSVFCNKIRTDL